MFQQNQIKLIFLQTLIFLLIANYSIFNDKVCDGCCQVIFVYLQKTTVGFNNDYL